ncbi:MAG: sulfurtransferase TusA family protein [Actinomycetota bacterium]
MTSGASLKINAQGLRCPMPVLLLARAAKGQTTGTVIDVVVTDPAAEHDIPAWCRMRGHAWIGIIGKEPLTMRVQLRDSAERTGI